jgi:hypothetical protein
MYMYYFYHINLFLNDVWNSFYNVVIFTFELIHMKSGYLLYIIY